MDGRESLKTRLRDFFSNPLIGILGSIASIISLFLAFYFYDAAREFPNLVYYISPSKSTIVKAGQSTNISVLYEKQEIRSDISAAQIAIWNKGTQSIKMINVLDSVILAVENNCPILEASIRKTSRNVVALQIDNKDAQKGRIGISWNILEKNDGGILQIIYAGTPNVNIQLLGIIEKQGNINELNYDTKKKIYNTLRQVFSVLTVIVLLLSFYFIKKHRNLDFRDWYWIIILLLYIGLTGFFYLFQIPQPGPPFGF